MFFLYKHIYVKRDPLTGPLLAQGHNLNKLSKGPPDDTKSIFSKNSFKNTIRVSNNLDPDQARHIVGPDLGPNCLQKLSTDNTSRQRVKQECAAI